VRRATGIGMADDERVELRKNLINVDLGGCIGWVVEQ
jgi:hypothetical protein